MSSAGPTIAGTGADNSGAGTTAWTNPGNVTANDSSYATCAQTTFNNNPLFSHYLKATNFGFSIPAGSTIDGIVVEVNKAVQVGSSNIQDGAVKLVNGSGTVVGNDKGDTTTNWGTSFSTKTYGSSSDTWGAGLTYSDINNSNFGVVLQCQQKTNFATSTAQVNYIQITVYYSSGTNHALTATVTAASAVAGTLTMAYALTGTVTGASSISGSLALSYVLTSTISAVSAITGKLFKDQPITSTISAASAISGALGINNALASSITAASAISGTLFKDQSISSAISAISAIVGSLIEDLAGTGTVSGASDIAGTLGVDRGLTGSISGASSITGTLSVVAGNRAPGILGDSNLCDLPP